MIPGRLHSEQIAQRAERLALVLDDLALHLADARHLDGDLGQAARVLGLVDRPRQRRDGFVDAGLPVRANLFCVFAP